MVGGTLSLSKAYFIALFCEAILHGVYTVLFGGTMYLLLSPGRRRQTKRTSLANVNMTVLTVIMYCLSTAHLALSLQQNLIAFFDQHAADGGLTILNDQGHPLVYCQITIEVINCLLSDSIVCWRTWVLWGRSYKVVAPPALCIIGGFACGIGVIRAFVISPPGEAVYSPEIVRWFSGIASLTCIANLYAVSAISYKAWICLKALRVLKNSAQGHGYHRTILLTFIESGAVYSVALIILVVLFELGDNAVYIIADMIPHLTGIYPTGIIVLVALNLTFHDDMARSSKTLTSLQCAPDTRNSLGDSRPYGPTVVHLRGNRFQETETGGTPVDAIEFAEGSGIELHSVGKSRTSVVGMEEGPGETPELNEISYDTKARELV